MTKPRLCKVMGYHDSDWCCHVCVPQGLSPIVENIIAGDLKRFDTYAKEQSLAAKA